jgi:alpha-beta hydrolase superfamily lysophospholipase
MEEKVIFTNSVNLKLSGVLHTPEEKTKKIVILSHGFTSKKDRPKWVLTAKNICDAGFGAFRFDFGGCGESEDRPLTVKDQIDDLKSAIDFVKEKGFDEIVLLGASLGALCSILNVKEKGVIGLILWAPLTDSKKPNILNDENVKKDLEEKGFTIIENRGKKHKVPKEYFEERMNINQKEILSPVKFPVLIIHGDKDEIVPIEHSQRAIELLPPGSELKVIEGGNHSLRDWAEDLSKYSIEWLKK